LLASVEIVGIASKVPERIVTNSEIEKLVDTSDEWIKKRSGINTRHIAVKERALDMAVEAAQKAVERSGIDKDEIGLIVSSTITSEYITPSMSSYVQKMLDIDNCACMDISAGCTGFLYALATAASLMDSLGLNAAVVVACEVLSKIVDWTDRSTCVLFGDGAGAIVLKRSSKACVQYPFLSGSPDKDNVLICRREPRKTPFNDVDESCIKPGFLEMNGREVFTYAVNSAEEVLNNLLFMCGDKPFTKIIPHQANEKIVDYIIRKMDLKDEQVYLNIAEYANTSSATIPIAMCDAYKKGWLKKGDRVALIAFGSGLTCGGAVIDWTL
jgi:3-oxoacyl-[acyl-carrier-protein] synthase-3